MKESEMVQCIKRRPLNEENGRRRDTQSHRAYGNKGVISSSARKADKERFLLEIYLKCNSLHMNFLSSFYHLLYRCSFNCNNKQLKIFSIDSHNM